MASTREGQLASWPAGRQDRQGTSNYWDDLELNVKGILEALVPPSAFA